MHDRAISSLISPLRPLALATCFLVSLAAQTSRRRVFLDQAPVTTRPLAGSFAGRSTIRCPLPRTFCRRRNLWSLTGKLESQQPRL